MKSYNIIIKGIIGVDFLHEHILTHLAAAKDCDVINLHIDSLGGDFDEGMLIYNTLKTCGKTIQSYNIGSVASIATLIWVAASNRIFDPKLGFFLIHNPWYPHLEGTVKDIDYYRDSLLESETQLAKIYSKETGIEFDLIKSYMDIDKPFEIDQIEVFNFAKLKNNNPIKAVAYKKQSNINQKSNNMAQKKTKVDELIDGIRSFLTGKIALVVMDVTGVEYDFDTTDILAISVGTPVTFEGNPYTGEVVTEIATYICDGGVVASVVENGSDPENVEELAELKAENERLKTEIETFKTETLAKLALLKKELAVAKTSQVNSQNVVDEPVKTDSKKIVVKFKK